MGAWDGLLLTHACHCLVLCTPMELCECCLLAFLSQSWCEDQRAVGGWGWGMVHVS